MKQKLLIIGAGMATAYLLKALQKFKHDLDITVCSKERDYCYNRVLLSNLLTGEVAEDGLAMLDVSQRATARFVTDTEITQIELMDKFALCKKGRRYPFDLLVFANGASNAVDHKLAATKTEGVIALRTLDDVRRLRELNAEGKSAVVVGGGLLGLEAAYGLNELSFNTTVVHRNPVLMNRQLDAEGGACLRARLEAMGIVFKLRNTVTEIINGNNRLSAVRLQDGAQLPCDLLLFASGIKPNITLAQAAGITTDRGILVDGYLATSAADVFALGECAQLGQHCFGLVAPIREQAAVLAAKLCRQPSLPYTVKEAPTQLKISGVDIYRAGSLDDDAEQILMREPGSGIYRRLVVRNDRLLGAVLVGDKSGGSWYADLIEQEKPLTDLRAGLVFGRDVATAMQRQAAI